MANANAKGGLLGKASSANVPSSNRILRALTIDEYLAIEPHLTEVPLEFKEILHEQGDTIDTVYFVEAGAVSLITVLTDGEIETGTIGNEGMVGVDAFLGADTAIERAICQIPGRAQRMKLATLRRQPADGLLHKCLARYTAAVMAMFAQTAACNRAHSLEQRMCRWLLMTLDRVGADEFPLTQEFLAQMLGVRRPSVSLAGITLQRAGLIRYSRGRITILDRKGLEAASCECYKRVRTEFDHALDVGRSASQRKRKGR